MRSTTHPWPAIADALAVLDLDATASWDDIRQSYRDRIRANHPDLGTDAGAARQAATINGAYTILREATMEGRTPLVAPAAPPPVRQPDRSPVILQAPSGDVYVRVLEAAYELGDVCYMDPEAGLIQVLLTDDGCAGAHLMIEIDQEVEPAQAAFTLESGGAPNVPPISHVVGRLATLLRAGATD